MAHKDRSLTVHRFLFMLLRYGGVASVFFALGIAFGAYLVISNTPSTWLRNQVLDTWHEREQDPGGQNAALRYWQTWRWAEPESVRAVDELSAEVREPGRNLGSEDRAVLADASVREFIDGVLRASRHAECDFGIAYEDGNAMASLMHLGYLRRSARVLLVDAYRCALDGDQEGVVTRLIAVLQMARHASSDRQAISCTVAIALTVTAADWARWFDGQQILSKESRVTFANEIKPFGEWDFGLLPALRMERSQAAIVFASTPFVGEGFEYSDEPDMKREVGLHVTGTFMEQTTDLRRFYDDVIAAWQGPNGSVSVTEVSYRAMDGEYGAAASKLSVAMPQLYTGAENARGVATKLAAEWSGED